MSARRLALKSNSISLSARQADALIKRGDGDAALLYLYLLRHEGYYDPREAQRALGWDQLRQDGALAHLRELGLVQGGPEEPGAESPLPAPEPEAPVYTVQDVAGELKAPGSDFSQLLSEVEKALGAPLTAPRDLQILLELYDHLALPPEVLLMLVNWQIQEYQRKYGPGRRPRMSQIRTAAYRWKREGIDTAEAVDAYLKKQDYYRSREGELLSAVGIHGRAAAAGEQKYLSQWAEWGLSAELAALAADRTVTNTGAFKWPYCHAILKRWHQLGARTPEEALALDKPDRPERPAPRRKVTAPAPGPVSQVTQAEQDRQVAENARWMQEFLRQQQGEHTK